MLKSMAGFKTKEKEEDEKGAQPNDVVVEDFNGERQPDDERRCFGAALATSPINNHTIQSYKAQARDDGYIYIYSSPASWLVTQITIHPILSFTLILHSVMERSSGAQLTALVVDDDMVNQKIHQRLLNSVGVKNKTVGNGKEAVDIHCSGQSFDLILMDMDMPIMNGIEATKKLRAMGIHSTIAGISTRSVEAQVNEFKEAGLDDYQEKPLTLDKLNSILHKIKFNPNY
ncbi:hypothetical protein L6164_033527 [Bauhinia variegata]|uniref:Uncharacterized protein n=1 Tax=Bauhinia variegata TaxID=167791 RepID=A0ACB9KS48_BAUVA|nr:hypothetical protein L6164_033527 [Bauhinia variegata]